MAALGNKCSSQHCGGHTLPSELQSPWPPFPSAAIKCTLVLCGSHGDEEGEKMLEGTHSPAMDGLMSVPLLCVISSM